VTGRCRTLAGPRTTTDADGRFTFNNIPAGQRRLQAHKESDGHPYNVDGVSYRHRQKNVGGDARLSSCQSKNLFQPVLR